MNDRVFDLRKRAYLYSLEIIRFIEKLPRDFICDVICRQLLRSATSIGANIIEAQAASSKKDFINSYNHSLKSANESSYWLGLLVDSGRSTEENASFVRKETRELSNILAASIIPMRRKK